MKFGTALLFNARADWIDSYVDYEALKKAIPEPAPAPAPVRGYTDLESAPLLPTDSSNTRPDTKPFFDILSKELRKVSKFYEIQENRLVEEGRALEREIEEDEDREKESVEVDGWLAAEESRSSRGDEGEEGEDDRGGEGESTIGSLGIVQGAHLAGNTGRGRLPRSRPSDRSTGGGGGGGARTNPSQSPTSRDTSDLFEAQQSHYATRLRQQAKQQKQQQQQRSSTDDRRPSSDGGAKDDDDSSPDNSPVTSQILLPKDDSVVKSSKNQHRRSSSSNNNNSLAAPPSSSQTRRQGGRRSSILSSSTSNNNQYSSAYSAHRPDPDSLGLVSVEVATLSANANANALTASFHSATRASGAAAGGTGEMVNVWTSAGQRASMLKIIYKRKIASLWLEWNALRGFRDLNQEGVKKALKKFDKITRSSTKDDFLAETLPTFYPWLAETKSVLDEHDHRLITTYARVVVGGDMELAGKQLGSQLREKVVIERDTIWRQMVTSQRSTEIPGGVIRALPNDRSNGLPTPDSKDPYYPILRTPLGTLYFPRWLSKGGAIFAMASVLLVLMCTGVIRTFARVEERNCLAMLVFCSILWATEAIPLFVTSLSVPFLVVVLRVIRSSDGHDTRLSASDATKYIFTQMFSPTIMLLIGGFTIAAALSKTRMDVIMATRILQLAGTRPSMVLLSQMAVATFASMWISNVAAPTLCFALIKPVLEKLPSGSQFSKCLIIAIALASNIGGMASPISSPQNLIALGAMEPALDWLQWFAISLPVASCSLILIWAFLHFGYRWDRDLVIPPIKASGGEFTRTHIYVLAVTLFTIGLWCTEKSLEGWVGDMGIIAIIPLVAFFGTSILSKEDFHNFHWSIVFLAMGGIALGKAVLSSGLLDDLDAVLQSFVSGMGLWAILGVFSVVAMVISTFISHTIAAVLLVPIASRIGESLEDPHPRLLIMATALICSAGMGLPVSGFPNLSAISQEDGLGNRYLEASDFLKNGIPSTVLSTAVVVTLGYAIMRVLGL